MRYDVTVHCIVKNEDLFISYALESIIPFVKKIIIYDTGSTDNTVQVIESLISKYEHIQLKTLIVFKKVKILSAVEISKLRQQQIKETNTGWFLLLDGDEIWPENEIKKLLQLTKELPNHIFAVVNQTRNCVGDIWHYLPEEFGKYTLLNRTGNLNIRLMKNLPYQVEGLYPNEAYMYKGKSINILNENLEYYNAWYLHATHLKRSSRASNVLGRRKPIYTKGIGMTSEELPEILRNRNNLTKRGYGFEIKAFVYDILRKLL